jgi:hypothetical protein
MGQRRNRSAGEHGNRGVSAEPIGGGFLARLVSELGRAAEDGWGPTLRWLVFLIFLVALVGAAAILTILSR